MRSISQIGVSFMHMKSHFMFFSAKMCYMIYIDIQFIEDVSSSAA